MKDLVGTRKVSVYIEHDNRSDEFHISSFYHYENYKKPNDF